MAAPPDFLFRGEVRPRTLPPVLLLVAVVTMANAGELAWNPSVPFVQVMLVTVAAVAVVAVALSTALCRGNVPLCIGVEGIAIGGKRVPWKSIKSLGFRDSPVGLFLFVAGRTRFTGAGSHL